MMRTSMRIEWVEDVVIGNDPRQLMAAIRKRLEDRAVEGYTIMAPPMPLCGFSSYGLLYQRMVPIGPAEAVSAEMLTRGVLH